MKILLIFASAVATASAGFAAFGGPSYVNPSFNNIANSFPNNENGILRTAGGISNHNLFSGGTNSGVAFNSGFNPDISSNNGGGQIRKFVSVHIAPQDDFVEPNVIRVGGGAAPDKHYNIIFVKAPSSSSEQPTEIILPEQPVQKSIVYVLVKKTQPGDNIRIRPSPAQAPTKPEVYFIRYKNPSNGISGGIDNGGIIGGGGGVVGVVGGGGGGAIPVRNSPLFTSSPVNTASSYGAP